MFLKTYVKGRNSLDEALDKDRGQMPPWGWGIVIVLIAIVCIIFIIKNVNVDE